MANIKRSIEGIVGGLVLLILSIYSSFMITAFSNIMPIASLKAIFWSGFISIWVLGVIVTPIMMIIQGQGNWLAVGKSFVMFVGGSLISVMLYYIGGGIADIFSSFLLLAGQITWLMLYAVWIFLMILLPSYTIIKPNIMENE